jgi:nucleotide-binding universal stress UspA family protein
MTTPRAVTGAAPLEPPVSSQLDRPILVATDGTAASDPALLAARALGARFGVPVRAVSVVPQPEVVLPSPEGIVMPAMPVADMIASRGSGVRDEMQRVLGDARALALEVRSGIAAVEVAEAARHMNAQLVVTGLRHHGRVDRLLRGETPLGILNASHVPTLAVPPGATQLPRSVLVAVDAGDPSVDAARYARPLVATARAVYLVHVQRHPDVAPPMMEPGWDQARHEAVQQAFDRVAAALELPSSVHVERKLFTGHVAHELLDFAEYAKVDLIVTGHRRRPLVERVFSGGTAARLFHGAARTWLLMVPEAARRG